MNLKKVVNFFQVAIHFHPSYPQSQMKDTSLCAPVGLWLIKLNNYCNVYIHTNVFFWLLRVTLKVGDTAPPKTFSQELYNSFQKLINNS